MQLYQKIWFFVNLLCYVTAEDIIISEKGSDTPSCLEEHDPLVSCQSLVKVSEYVTSHKLNNVTIRINDTNYTLQGVANFSEVENITITGKGRSLTHINCNSTNPSGAGIVFEHSSNISLSDFSITNCAAYVDDKKISHLTGNATAVLIYNSLSAMISCLKISCSKWRSLTILDTAGLVQMDHSEFTCNTNSGGGASIILNKPPNDIRLSLTVSDCNFTNNTASVTHGLINTLKPPRYTRGGGIGIQLLNRVHANTVLLRNVVAYGNTAVFGGGLYVYCEAGTYNNTITVLNSNFTMNTASVFTGGGAYVEFSGTTTFNNHTQCNAIRFQRLLFCSNTAHEGGGGLGIFFGGVKSFKAYPSVVEIMECKFFNNTGTSGTAVIVSPVSLESEDIHYRGMVWVYNCQFHSNHAIGYSTKQVRAIHNGAFTISKIPVRFSDNISFIGNTDTALHVTSAAVSFKENSQFFFSDNTGYCGGAIHLGAGSKMYVERNSTFSFTNNTATLGGALCVLEELHGFSFAESCFIFSKESTNVSFYFSKNSASSVGSDIFTSSLLFCVAHCQVTNTELFTKSCIGVFYFDGQIQTNITDFVATYPLNILTAHKSELNIIPGRRFNLQIQLVDEVGHNVTDAFPFTVKVHSFESNTSTQLDYNRTGNNDVTLFGEPGWSGRITVALENFGIRRSMDFMLTNCPPGFSMNGLKCECLSGVTNKKSSEYRDILCIKDEALFSIGFWVGYIGNVSENNLFVGQCAAGLCTLNLNKPGWTAALPASSDELDSTVCYHGRHGLLCGKCDDNRSVHYHSATYACHKSDTCSYGIPLYILSELLPVTIFFLLILLFKVRLTSGALYSFVFFAQVIPSLSINTIDLELSGDTFSQALFFFVNIYDIFNLEPSSGRFYPSFCVVPTNTLMILFIFNYLTILYVLFLVLATIFVLRVHSCYSCVKLCRRCGRRNIRGSIVDGLSAFLVLCYYKCADITVHILTPSHIYGIRDKYYKTVPLYDGSLDYLKGEHLYYAVPAFLCLSLILIPVPVILFLEPILTKMFSIEWFTDSKLKELYDKSRLQFMPYLDSFQGCFKDKHRYFAGLYFLYRLVFPLLYLNTTVVSKQIFLAQTILFVIVVLHIVVRPYQKTWHNIAELMILVNILFITTITSTNYSSALNKHYLISPRQNITFGIQIVLLGLPLLYVACYATVNICKKVPLIQKCSKKTILRLKQLPAKEDSDDELPARLRFYNTF